MQVNGIDLDGLCHSVQSIDPPDTVKGRVVQIDADFLAYQVSAERPDEDKSLSDMKHNCDVIIETLRLLAGAETVSLHLTPKDSNKGGRYDQAMLKEYQANRDGKEKPRFLHVIRAWLAQERGAILHMNCEADDGMAMAQYKAISEGNGDLSIIASKDKDLRMVTGLHLNWDTGEIHETDEFGSIYLDESTSSKLVKGYGWKFFWAQMLMGDTADNISGLPFVTGDTLLRYTPTKADLKNLEILADETKEKRHETAQKNLDKALDKTKPCGAVLAYKLLEPIQTNKEAYEFVRELYKKAHEVTPFVNYRNGREIKWGEAFLSEGYLLWMRRHDDPIDFYNWLVEQNEV